MDRSQIHFLRFLLEAYEGAAILSTIDKTSGLVTLRIAPGREAEVAELLTDLKERIMIEPVCEEMNIQHPTSNGRLKSIF